MTSQYIDHRSLTAAHISSCHESEHLLHSSRQEKKRMMQAQHRATIARLIKNVKNIVWSDGKRSPTKCQILIEAKKFLHQQEKELVRLLKLKEHLQLGDNGLRNLEEVKQEFRKFYYTSSSPSDLKSLQKQECHVKEVIPTSDCEQNLLLLSSANVILQEGQTINIWMMKRPVVAEETSFPLVSKAFSCLWDSGQQKVVIPFVKAEQMSFSRQKSEDLVQTELKNNHEALNEIMFVCSEHPEKSCTPPFCTDVLLFAE
ncbi:uncharacterized protein LOC127526795 [Erpetoichthys calabaricus]|uniref:uncharacterized protein LOC127526795 n=1 Tax=Erpetoichthys calabaricus TaxID=27687 RepID=UPI0022346669|nr:uncharacterized protein LOC127526795 [Erpetoichthys calabaricus]